MYTLSNANDKASLTVITMYCHTTNYDVIVTTKYYFISGHWKDTLSYMQIPINSIVVIVDVDVTPDLSKGQVTDQQCPAQGSSWGLITTLQYKDAR